MNDSMIKVAVADDNPGMRQYVAEAVNESRDMEMVGEATDGEALLELVKVTRPDIVLADLIMPHYDGYMFIEKIRNMADMVPPDIMIISAVSSEIIVNRALAMGAKYYLIKPFEKEVLRKRIYDVLDMGGIQMDTGKSKDDRMRVVERITNILLSIGISAGIQGYRTLKDAVILSLENPVMSKNLTKNLYPAIAEMHHTTPKNVERSIRHAIDTSWQQGKLPRLNAILNIDVCSKNEKLTNRELIALLTEHLMIKKYY